MERYELTLNDGAGALARVISVITARRWSLGRLEYDEDTVDRHRLVVDLGGRRDQIETQLGKLYDVLAVRVRGVEPS
jgi:acetolactate synthase small subunit